MKKNKITNPEVTKKIEELRHGPDMAKVRALAYLLAATEKTPGVAERVRTLVALLGPQGH